MSDLRIKTCVLGDISTNCYLVYRDSTKEAFIVDPADNSQYILTICRELDLKPRAILLTHGHFDHVMAVEDLKRSLRLPVYACDAERELMKNSQLNLSDAMGSCPVSIQADEYVKDGDVIEQAGFAIKVIHTPGHTVGSVSYYLSEFKVLFSGDTLFANSHGRVDMPTSSYDDIEKSILGRLFLLPEDVMVYPGHGGPTTIGHEKEHNLIVVSPMRRRV